MLSIKSKYQKAKPSVIEFRDSEMISEIPLFYELPINIACHPKVVIDSKGSCEDLISALSLKQITSEINSIIIQSDSQLEIK